MFHLNFLQHAKSNVEIRECAKIPVEELQVDPIVQPINIMSEGEYFCLPTENSSNEILDLSNVFNAPSSFLVLERATRANYIFRHDAWFESF